MLVLETRRWLAWLPLLARAGLVWLLAALAIDASIHAAHDFGHFDGRAHALAQELEYIAHVAVVIGMALIYLGVVVGGVRKSRRALRSGPGRE